MVTLAKAFMRKPFAVVGHRGSKGTAPENTLLGLEHAMRAGADIAEFDAQLTADGVPVASHDPEIRSDPGEVVDIRGTTYAELSRFTVSGERIPTIKEVIEFARGKIALFIEVKDPNDAEAVISLIKGLRAEEFAAVISFHKEAAALAAREGLWAGIIYFRPPGAIIDAKKLGCRLVLPRYPLATKKAVTFAHRLGLKVVAWTVNDEDLMRELAGRGVDAIATDYPGLGVKVRDELANR